MQVALAQINPTVGDVDGNARLIMDVIDRAVDAGADLLVTSELALIGYPPRDLLLREGVVAAAEAAIVALAEHAAAADTQLTAIVGYPRRETGGLRPLRNSAAVLRGGRIIDVYDKRLLPGYDVFDEDRYFQPGTRPCVVEVAGRRLGLLICDDLWRADDVLADCQYPVDPVQELVDLGCDGLIALNASPFVLGKWQRHLDQLQATARRNRLPVIAVNQVGGNDDLIFDGRSVAMGSDGVPLALLPGWKSAVTTIDWTRATPSAAPHVDPYEELMDALTLGVADYCGKSGHRGVIIGCSGGIDSAMTAVIAVRALGAENVSGLYMPSRYSARESEQDAAALAANLGLAEFDHLPIHDAHQTMRAGLDELLGASAEGVVDENIQARVRGVLLMACSNAGRGLVLATSNKSELAMGYSTLYGDMCGALCVLGDVTKTQVYELARWTNRHHRELGFRGPPIPERSITRPPTAELRPDQTDQDTLPPYDQLDAIVERYVDREQSAERIIEETELDPDLIRKTVLAIDRAQYKREQSALILKVAPRTFGRGRPMPIVMKQTGRVEPVGLEEEGEGEGVKEASDVS